VTSQNPPDFVIRGGINDGKTVDFLYTVNSPYSLEKFNTNFLANPRTERIALRTIIDHVEKADIVPMDFRTLNSANQIKFIEKILPKLTPDQKAKLLIIR
jgi:hypothetical protein